jgi:hypothetical protein
MVGLGLIVAAVASCPAPAVKEPPNPVMRSLRMPWFTAEPRQLYGLMWSGRAVDGRWSLYAHGGNPVTGISEKTMWVVDPRARLLAGPRLRLAWRRDGRVRRVQRFGWSPDSDPRRRRPRVIFYPSIPNAPSPGCWKLRLKTGQIKTTIRVLVIPQPQRRP